MIVHAIDAVKISEATVMKTAKDWRHSVKYQHIKDYIKPKTLRGFQNFLAFNG